MLEDNDWLRDLAADCTIIVAVVGNIEPGTPEFGSHLEQFVRNPVFRGIRFGTLWGRSLTQALSTRQVIADLKLLASAELELDVIGNDWTLLGDVVRLTDCVPDLRVVINHLPEIDPPTETRSLDVYRANLQKLAQRPQVYAKLSALLRRVAGRVSLDLNFYRPRLDEVWTIFGPDRLIYGSDWPNSDLMSTYEQLLTLLRQYFREKGEEAEAKFFRRNSAAAYRWLTREPNTAAF